MNARYSKILCDCFDWQSFFEAVLSCTNLPSDSVIKEWIKTKDNTEMVELFDKIKSDISIIDVWQCRYYLYNIAKSISVNLQDNVPSFDDILSDQGSSDSKPLKKTIIGVELKSKLKLFIKRIIVAIRSKEGGLFVIVGNDKSGKTTILSNILNSLESMKLTSTPLEFVQQSAKARDLFVPTILPIDNVDYELNMGLDAKLLIGLKTKTFKSTIIVTCNDISTIGKISSTMSPKILVIPEYSQSEIIEILASIRYYDHFSVDKNTCKLIVAMLNSVMEPNIISVAIEMINYMVLLGNSNDTFNNINSFNRNEIAIALLTCTGKAINLDYDDVLTVLKTKIVDTIKGQDTIIDQVLPILTNIQTGLSDPTKPAGVILAVGPTGVGKTEMGKAIADILYHGVLFKEDMNTYFEKHMVSKLIGSPPGYTGSQDIPALLSFVKTHKSGVILLDEIEKAHQSVQDTIMEMIDTGYMRDACGRVYDFRGFFIFMTSNAGYDSTKKESKIGFGESKSNQQSDIDILHKSGIFSKSFLARSTVVFFKDLSVGAIDDIAYDLIYNLSYRLESIGLDVEPIIIKDIANIVDMVVSKFDKESGARSMRLFVEHDLKNIILEKLKFVNKTEKQYDKTFQV